MFAVVGRVRFVDECRAGGGEFRPRDVDAVLEWRAGAAWVGGGLRGRAGAPVIVDGHELLVLERKETPLESGFEDGTSWKVERGAEVLRGPEDEEPAGPVRIRCRHGAALEYLAGEIRVALAIPSHGCVSAGLPVLAGGIEVCRTSPGEVVWNRRVVPVAALVQAVGDTACAVAPAVVIVARDDVIGLVGIGRDGRLVLRLTASLQIWIAQVQAVLVDLDVRREIRRAAVAPARKVIGRFRPRLPPAIGAQFVRGESRKEPFLDVVQLLLQSRRGRDGGCGRQEQNGREGQRGQGGQQSVLHLTLDRKRRFHGGLSADHSSCGSVGTAVTGASERKRRESEKFVAGTAPAA